MVDLSSTATQLLFVLMDGKWHDPLREGFRGGHICALQNRDFCVSFYDRVNGRKMYAASPAGLREGARIALRALAAAEKLDKGATDG